jgi:hypothetical protein
MGVLRGFVGPYYRDRDGDAHSPWNHYRAVRRTFGQSRFRAALSTWLAYYVNWNEKQARP